MASMKQNELRKEAQIRKEQKICSDFLRLRNDYPNERISTLFDTLAEQYLVLNTKQPGLNMPITGMRIRQVIINNGIYTPAKLRQCPS